MWPSVVTSCGLLAVVLYHRLGEVAVGPGVLPCTDGLGALPLSARVEGCAGPPCALPQAQDAVVDVVFRAPHDISNMTTSATAYLFMMGIPIPIPYDLAEKSLTCNYLNSSCPVREGDILLYTLRIYVDPDIPVGLEPTVEFSIMDDNSAAVACLRMPVLIAPPAQPQHTADITTPK